MINQYAKRVDKARFFTGREAWNLFRLAAFGEAFGWTLLISSLIFKHYVTPNSNIPVEIAGQIHGTLFLIYIAATVVLHPSLRFSPKTTLIAGLVSVPPYGTLVFEQWVARGRHRELLKSYRKLIVRGIISYGGKVLALQPKDSGLWQLPGGEPNIDEPLQKVLIRTINELTSIKPQVGPLAYVWQHKRGNTQVIELFFIIENTKDFKHIKLSTNNINTKELDEIGFIHLKTSPDLRPKFLQSLKPSDLAKNSKGLAVKFI